MSNYKKIAIAQISAKRADLDYNTRKVIRIIKENKDADLIIFPELILQGHHHRIHPEYSTQSIDIGTLEKIQEVCAENEASVVVGALECIKDNNYNCAFYIDKNKIDRYVKTHVHWTEEFTPGNELRCIETNIGKLGMMICFDSAFSELPRCLALMGAKVFAIIGVVPTDFNEVYMTRRLQAIAVTNQAFVLYANKWKKGKYNGGSCVIGPKGDFLARLGDQEGTLKHTINLDEVDKWREEERIYQNRRPELYSKITEK
jgi:predicted amidohydrolase